MNNGLYLSDKSGQIQSEKIVDSSCGIDRDTELTSQSNRCSDYGYP